MVFLNYKGKTYSFILLLFILQNSYADDVKSQERTQELQSVDDTNPTDEAKNVQVNKEDQVSSRSVGPNTSDVSSVQTNRALDESTPEEESDQSNPLEDGFIVLPLKSKYLLTEGLTITPNVRPSTRSLNNQRPTESRTEIARQQRAKDRSERQKIKMEKKNVNETRRFQYRVIRPPISRWYVEDPTLKKRRVPSTFLRRRSNKKTGSIRGRTTEIPMTPKSPFQVSELREENDVSLPAYEIHDLRNQEDGRDFDPPRYNIGRNK